ncbi:hypothetical protein UFOVP232_21 [uncultured Caudovirales phage]|uniref:Uncharacterized protein n=1 Tax=uncultured Caudovirales phage TaxID=2100421 RepID=A0A6J7WQ16_9CAUD|nr:hypothetical protein UFOVP232_21 [uncultured Caudovirales phage]
MSKRNRGQKARARRNKLLVMRAELAILLENRLHTYHVQLNTHSTEKLLEHVREFNVVPLWAERNYVKESQWDWLTDDKTDAFTYFSAGLDKLLKPLT